VAESGYSFRDPKGFTRAARWSLWSYMAIVICIMVAPFVDLNWLQATLGLSADVRRALSLATKGWEGAALLCLLLIVFLATPVLVLRWIYLASANAHALVGDGMRFSPGWAVGWYFVPVANFWKPYQAMKEIWQLSSGRPDWKMVPAPAVMRWWWGLWLLSSGSSVNFGDEPMGTGVLVLLLVFAAIWVSPCIPLIIIMNRICKMQADRAKSAGDPRFVDVAVTPS
jgi:Domain of unknown function (DUF4328)